MPVHDLFFFERLPADDDDAVDLRAERVQLGEDHLQRRLDESGLTDQEDFRLDEHQQLVAPVGLPDGGRLEHGHAVVPGDLSHDLPDDLRMILHVCAFHGDFWNLMARL